MSGKKDEYFEEFYWWKYFVQLREASKTANCPLNVLFNILLLQRSNKSSFCLISGRRKCLKWELLYWCWFLLWLTSATGADSWSGCKSGPAPAASFTSAATSCWVVIRSYITQRKKENKMTGSKFAATHLTRQSTGYSDGLQEQNMEAE